MRKIILLLAFALSIYFLYTRFHEMQSVVGTLQRGEINFILAALLLLFVWYVNVAATYRAIYEIVGLNESIGRLFLLSISAFFANIVAPVAGMTGIAMFVNDGRARGQSAARVTVATAMYILFDYVGFLVVLTLGLAVLARRNELEWPEISASIVLVIIALGITVLLYLGAKSGRVLGDVLASLAGIVNRIARPFIHRDYLSIERAHSFAAEAAEGLSTLQHSPTYWIKPLVLALNNKAILITIMMMTFLAFRQPFTAGTIIAGFSIGYLFLIVSPTPSGIGVVEGIMTLGLTSLRVPFDSAAVIVLAYRGITFWFPLLPGLVAFRFISKENRQLVDNSSMESTPKE
jgi:uncharacterized protein (TIRG00374 family)